MEDIFDMLKIVQKDTATFTSPGAGKTYYTFSFLNNFEDNEVLYLSGLVESVRNKDKLPVGLTVVKFVDVAGNGELNFEILVNADKTSASINITGKMIFKGNKSLEFAPDDHAFSTLATTTLKALLIGNHYVNMYSYEAS